VAGLVLVDAWQESLQVLLGPEQWAAYEVLASGTPPGLEQYHDLELIDFAATSERMGQIAAEYPYDACRS
jgi:hypothetical protein